VARVDKGLAKLDESSLAGQAALSRTVDLAGGDRGNYLVQAKVAEEYAAAEERIAQVYREAANHPIKLLTLSYAAQGHLGKYKKRMQEETNSAESAGKDEDAIIAHVLPLLREEMRRDSLTEETAEELIKRLVEDYQCESESDEEDDEADEQERERGQQEQEQEQEQEQ
jgi:hypothetical protein